MRVEGGAARAPGAEPERARFGEALARAERDGRADREERGARGAARIADARARGEARLPEPRRLPAVGEPAGGRGEDARAAALPAPTQGRPEPADVAPVPELASLARALPPAIAALGPVGGSPLALSFGRSLDVELRSTAAGVEVVLRPEPGLARAAEAELPRLVAALRVRGVSVARAEVRPRGQPGNRAR